MGVQKKIDKSRIQAIARNVVTQDRNNARQQKINIGAAVMESDQEQASERARGTDERSDQRTDDEQLMTTIAPSLLPTVSIRSPPRNISTFTELTTFLLF